MFINFDKKCVFEKSDRNHYFVIYHNAGLTKGPVVVIFVIDVQDLYVICRVGEMGGWCFSIKTNGIYKEKDVREASPLEIILLGSAIEPQEMLTQEETEDFKKRKESDSKTKHSIQFVGESFRLIHRHLDAFKKIQEKIKQKEVSKEEFTIYRSMCKNKKKCLNRLMNIIKKEVDSKW